MNLALLVNRSSLYVCPDYKLMDTGNKNSSCIVGLGCLESSFYYQAIPSINSFTDPDVPALMLYLQYLIQAEVRAFWGPEESFRLFPRSCGSRAPCGNKLGERGWRTGTRCSLR